MKDFLKKSYLSTVYVCIYAPIAVLVLFSFNDANYSLKWHGFTWKWYGTLIQNKDLLLASRNSFILALTSATLSLVMGLFITINLYKYAFKGRQLYLTGILTIIVLPDIIVAINLVLSFKLMHIPLGFYTLLLAHVSFSIPFVVTILLGRLSLMDKNILNAAKDLGAGASVILKRVFMPYLLPSMCYVFLLCFALSFDDVVISYFASGPGYEILPLKIYSMVRNGIKPEINAISSLLLMFTMFLIIIMRRYFRYD